MRRCILGLALAALAGLAGGCGESGPKRYRVSGSVTFDGQPVPAGMVIFTPDPAKGNTGPQGKAVIRDGKFDTEAEGGLGAVGGPVIIEVAGQSGDRPLCEYRLPVDLPKENTTRDIPVPKEAGVKPGAAVPPA